MSTSMLQRLTYTPELQEEQKQHIMGDDTLRHFNPFNLLLDSSSHLRGFFGAPYVMDSGNQLSFSDC